MCITLADADRVIEAPTQHREGRSGRLHEAVRRAWERMLEGMPESAESLRYISVVVHDPEFIPFFGPGEIARGSDIPADVLEGGREQMRTQVREAVGGRQPGRDHRLRRCLPGQPRPRRETSCTACSSASASRCRPR